MTAADRDDHAPRLRSGAVSTVVWNIVVPALGLALLLGASVLPAIAIAGAASITIIALASKPRRLLRRRWGFAHVASHRVLQES